MACLNGCKVKFFLTKLKHTTISREDTKLSDEVVFNHCTFKVSTPEMLQESGSIHLFHVQLLCLKCWEEIKMHDTQILLSGDLQTSSGVKAKITGR